MLLRRIFAIFLLIGCPLRAFPISIIGNASIGDRVEGFEMPLVGSFLTILQTSGGGLRLITPFQISGTGIHSHTSPISIEMRIFSSELPDLKTLIREELRDFFLGNPSANWQKVMVNESCVDAYLTTNQNSTSIVVSWGDGRGYLMSAPNIPILRNQMQQMVEQTRLDEGACSWK